MNRDSEYIREDRGSEGVAFQLPVLDAGASADAARSESLETKHRRIDLAAVRAKLEGSHGDQYWRGLEELAETEEFKDLLAHEFAPDTDTLTDPVTRRGFMKVMGASLALAGLGACVRQPEEKIVPFVKAPEQYVPGKPLFFASAYTMGGYATGVLVESHMGRPTKIEGNPDHPASLGATDTFAQASVLTLYDPDRSQTVVNLGEISTWDAFQIELVTELDSERTRQGAGLRILTETVTSPTMGDQIARVLQAFPGAKWHQYEPAGRDGARMGNRSATGRAADAIYHFGKADVVVSLDADFLGSMPGSVRYSREFIDRRRLVGAQTTMNRLYVAEPTPTITGAMADHRLPIRAGLVAALAQAIAAGMGIGTAPTNLPQDAAEWAAAVAADLTASRGRGIVVAGDTQPAAVHQLAHAINERLGNIGPTVSYIPPVEVNPVDQTASLRELVADMAAGNVQVLLILGGNPVYNAPVDLEFGKHLRKVKLCAHLGLYNDETSWLSHWHIPESHYLESWGDARAYDGTVSIVQPLIAPLYQSRTAYELLAILTGDAGRTTYEIVRDYWSRQGLPGNFETTWQVALHDGFLRTAIDPAVSHTLPTESAPTRWNERAFKLDTAGLGPRPPVVTQDRGVTDTARTITAFPPRTAESPAPTTPAAPQSGGLEIVFRPDPTIWDGSFANNGWLQELPKPITKITWDNVVCISPATAERLGVTNQDVVQLTYRNRSVTGPVWVMPGQADESVTVFLGYGRQRAGRVGNGIGYNAYALRTAAAPWFDGGLTVTPTGDTYPIATTQHHHSMEGRDLVRTGTLEGYRKDPSLKEGPSHGEGHTSMYPEYKYEGYAWGMAIDTNACIGCSACVVACVAENNIPVVGKDQVSRGREMHWLRIDSYYKGGIENPQTVFQPVPCMHCENAPCEVVCPVNATVHSHEGLNDMVYNRCVGTRYCSNNCPYKVRRYNFLQYADETTPSLKLRNNPDVTVRTRGVMEKCTYCVQRINHARIEAKKENRQIRDGEIETACQAVCPTEAIVFGDINNRESNVVKMKSDGRNYALLAELNTQPRTTYLGRVRNPNPALDQFEKRFEKKTA